VVRSLEEINRNSTMASLTYKLYRFILEKEDEAAAELNAVDTDSIETKVVKSLKFIVDILLIETTV